MARGNQLPQSTSRGNQLRLLSNFVPEELHAHKMHAYEMHAYEMHAYKMDYGRCTFVKDRLVT